METSPTIAPPFAPAPTHAVEKIALTAAETRAALGGISDVTLWRLSKRRLLMPIPGIRHRLYSVAAIKRFAESR